MRDAIGGVFSLQIIVIFMLIVNGYLAFTVNYTKAFRVKNQIIQIIEQHEGFTEDAKEKIDEYMRKTNYELSDAYTSWCQRNGLEVYRSSTNGAFCYTRSKVDISGGSTNKKNYQGSYYSIQTFVNIDIPVINKLLPFTAGLFRVGGETSMIFSSGNNSEVTDQGGGGIIDPS